jgi:hypothetical protein
MKETATGVVLGVIVGALVWGSAIARYRYTSN